MTKTLIKNAMLVNNMNIYKADVLIVDGKIDKIIKDAEKPSFYDNIDKISIINADGLYLLPGVIDDQVHFREPGLTQKADIYTESKAAVAGGITSFMEMPNTKPQTITQERLESKFDLAASKSLANYSFYMGATNDNLNELIKTDPSNVCGIKVFMGSSTGNMLVDQPHALDNIFKKSPLLIATHCEEENMIRKNMQEFRTRYGENVPMKMHPQIRSREACFISSSKAVKLAKKYHTRLHVLHISTAKELELFDPVPLNTNKRITAEVCVHHLWFDSNDYEKYGTRIKWNPAIKYQEDKEALINGIKTDLIDVIATDHAPHTLEEKKKTYFKAPSGGPLVQHSLTAMLELYHQGKISLEKIVQKMCHHPSELFQIDKRGYIREGYWADLVLIDLNAPWTVETSNVLYKCKWSPFESQVFKSTIKHTFVNGVMVYDNGSFIEDHKGMRLTFNR